MPADTFSSTLGTLVMGTGNDNNNWGDLANASIFQIFEDAIANVLPGPTGSVTGGTLDLSTNAPPAGPSQARYMHLRFTGALTANQTVIVPNKNKLWLVSNATSGAHSLLMQVAGGNTIQIPQNAALLVSVNAGATTIFRLDASEVGEVKDFARTSAPPGYLECDGSSLLRVDYPDLFAAIGTAWGAVDGAHFTLPLLNDSGRFRRARSTINGTTVGTYQGNQNLQHSHATSLSGAVDAVNLQHNHGLTALKGDTTGQVVANTNGSTPQHHTHQQTGNTVSGNGGTHIPSSPGLDWFVGTSTGIESNDHVHYLDWSGKGTDNALANHSHGVSGITVTNPPSGGNEARPEAAVMMTCIRY